MNSNLAALATTVTETLLASGGQLKGEEILFRCLHSGHDDSHPSARWKPSEGIYFCDPCAKGGGTVALAQLLGIQTGNRNGAQASSPKGPTGIYKYTDAKGSTLFVVCRFDKPSASGKPKKTFLQCHYCPQGTKGITWNLGGDPRKCRCKRITPVLFNLPELLDSARGAEPVFIVEGEKCAMLLSALGVLATTSPGGAGKWRPDAAGLELARPLSGRHILILPDNDEPGRKHAESLARAVQQAGAADIRVLDLPDLPPKGDVADWMEACKEEDKIGALRRLAESAPRWKPTFADASSAQLGELLGDERFTDTGNAKRLVLRRGNDLRYCYQGGKWLVWDGRRWRIDDGDCVMLLAKETARAIYTEAAATEDSEDAEALSKHATSSLSEKRLRAMIALACSECPIAPQEFDADPWLLNVANGTLDLRSGALREHRRDDRLSKLVPVAFDSEAACPTWHTFLLRIFNGNEALIAFVQRAVGYGLTGHIREQVLFFLHGTGANGKSTFLEALLSTLGPDYAIQAAPNLLMAKNFDAHPTEVADLHGKRFVATVEVGEGRKLAEVLVKQLTGGDTLKARRMREDFWSFAPTFKIFLAANHKPAVTGTDHAIWRRIQEMSRVLLKLEWRLGSSSQNSCSEARIRGQRLTRPPPPFWQPASTPRRAA
ncbi:MAG: hypothetical protein IT452_16255 [Planctomycetia bacterium]|nr:hypothetical protein [Planctomycetia bacterium]